MLSKHEEIEEMVVHVFTTESDLLKFEIEGLNVRCVFCAKGCQRIARLWDIEEHEETC